MLRDSNKGTTKIQLLHKKINYVKTSLPSKVQRTSQIYVEGVVALSS